MLKCIFKQFSIHKSQAQYSLLLSVKILYTIQSGPNKTAPNFGDHFDLLPEKFNNLFLDAIKDSLLGIICENMNDIEFILCKI